MNTVEEQQVDLKKLEQTREKILRLSVLQQELHTLVSQKKPQHLSQGTFVGMIGKQRSSILRFLSQQQATGKGKMLSELTAFVQRPDIADRIERESLEISEKELGLSILPRNAIVRAFKIFEAYEKFNEPGMTQALFAKAFPESYQKVVEKTFLYSQDAIRKLSDEAVWTPLQEILQEESLVYLLEIAKRGSTARTQEKCEKCREIWERIRTRFEMFSETAHAVGLAESTLRKIFRDTVSEKTIDQILGKLMEAEERLTSPAPPKQEDPPERETPKEEVPVEETPIQEKPPAVKDVRELAGVPSPLGVPYTLGPDSLKSIALETDELANQLQNMLKKSTQITRILINTVIQLTDQTVKRNIREDIELAYEVEELNLAIRAFSIQNPNNLLPLIQAQREAFAGDSEKKNRKDRREK